MKRLTYKRKVPVSIKRVIVSKLKKSKLKRMTIRISLQAYSTNIVGLIFQVEFSEYSFNKEIGLGPKRFQTLFI